MQNHDNSFGVPLCRFPLINLRTQFFRHYHLFKDKKFLESLRLSEPGTPIETPYITWYYWTDQFYTFIVQHAVIGVEAYLTGAVFHELGKRGELSPERLQWIRNPFKMKGARKSKEGTATKYYALLPSLVSPEIALDKVNPALWEKVSLFYQELRNPLFHGWQIDSNDPVHVVKIFELLADVYGWIDSWHNPDDIIPGISGFTKLNRA